MNRRTPHFSDHVEIVQTEEDGGWEPPPTPRRGPRLVPALLVTLVAAGFGGALWYAYGGTGAAVDGTTVPIVSADATPMKYRPERPGGMEVPHQDKLVFSRLAPGNTSEMAVEQILPPPETPLPKPEPVVQAEPEPVEEPEPNEPPAAAADAPAAPSETPEPVAVAADAPPPSLPELDKPLLPEATAPSVAPPLATEPAPEPAAPEPAAPAVAAASGGYRVQLASVRDESSAQAEIRRLQSKHPDELSDLGMTAVRADLGEKGIFFRVQGGPVDAIRAAAICDSLKAQGVACLIVKP